MYFLYVFIVTERCESYVNLPLNPIKNRLPNIFFHVYNYAIVNR